MIYVLIDVLPPLTLLVPVVMTALTSPTPSRIVDKEAIGSLHQNQEFEAPERLCPNSTITLYELIQFCHLSSIYVPPNAPNCPLRRKSWQVGELIPGLGIRVSVVKIKFPAHSRPPRAQSEDTGCWPLSHTGRSAFTPVAGPAQDRCALPLPWVLMVDEVSVAGSAFFQQGQIILEVNGVNLFSVPSTSKRDLWMRLIQAIFSAYGGDNSGFYITLATPYPWLVRRATHEIVETRPC